MRIISKRFQRDRDPCYGGTHVYRGVQFADNDGNGGLVVGLNEIPHLIKFLEFVHAEKDYNDKHHTEAYFPHWDSTT